MSKQFLIALIAVLVAVANATTCPLCGEAPVTQPPPIPNEGPIDFEFDVCCPYAENGQEGCVLNPLGEAERVTSLDAPIIADGEEFEDYCMTMDNFRFEEPERTPCCVTCSCFGDPNCIDFAGGEETWIVCDGRTVPTDPLKLSRGFCKITEEQCAQETDPFGEPCRWLPTEENIPASQWSIREDGSPCAPTGVYDITMYEADTFKFVIGQGDRGYITETEVTFGSSTWTMTASDCVNKGYFTTWQGPPIPDTFKRYEEECAPDGNNDVLWALIDPETGISAHIRCTSYKVLAAKLQPRMNIEAVNEPDPDFEEDRNPLGGFCVTGDLGNTNPSENTQNIAENGYCFANAPQDNVTISRIVCQNPSITLNGVAQCQKDFCNQYWMPYYDSAEECYETIKENYPLGFCRAFNNEPGDIDECLALIAEEGWAQAVFVYYNRAFPTTNCIENFEDLPDSLEDCEKGVMLQYLDPNDGWVTKKAISEKMPVCANAEFNLCVGEYPELFNNRIRWAQKRQVVGCLVDECEQVDGFFTQLETEKITLAPTESPSRSPTRSPTKMPTDSPTKLPTVSPTRSPTKMPTESPTFSPTGGRQPPFLCPAENLVPLNILDSTIRFNNLGGQGPISNDTCPFIWFEKVMNIVGQDVDLVMRVFTGDYRPSNLNPNANDGVSNNGKYFELGQVNMACDSTVVLEFIFIRSDCSRAINDPCSIATNDECDIAPDSLEGDGLLFTTYDLDHFRNQQNIESVIYCNTLEVLNVEGSKVDVDVIQTETVCENATQFVATTFGNEADNPQTQALDSLTEDQRQKVAQVRLIPGLSRVLARFGITGPDNPNSNPRCGRRILFSADFCDLVPTVG